MKLFIAIAVFLLLVACASKNMTALETSKVDEMLSKVEVPVSRPEVPSPVDLGGIVNIPQGVWTNEKGKKFTVGQGGGAFLPKRALEQLKYDIRVHEIYEAKLIEALDKKVETEIKAIVPKDVKTETKEPSWFGNILGGGKK